MPNKGFTSANHAGPTLSRRRLLGLSALFLRYSATGIFSMSIPMRIQTQPTVSYDELYRPQFHFSPPDHWMNDPNGLIYYEGEYHLFYQHDPHSLDAGPMHWGHAVSTDLIHWTHLPIALYPDAIGPIWSGSAVNDAHNTSGLVPGGGLIAVYSYKDQSQGIAASSDKGRTWTKYPQNPVIPVGGKDFRDPKVFWHTETKQWVMILAAADRVKLYTSPNLITWTFASDFGVGQGIHWGTWECPDLFPMTLDGQTHWVLTNSMSPGTQYFIGSFDGRTFTNSNPANSKLLFDHGPDNYASVTWNDTPDGSHLLIGWMDNWKYARQAPTPTWRGTMTVPRVLTLRQTAAGIRLIQAPIPQIEQLRGDGQHWRDQSLTPGQNVLSGVTGRVMDIVAEIEIGSAMVVGLKVLKGGEQATTIGYDVRSQTLFVDRTNAGVSDFTSGFADVYQSPLSLEAGSLEAGTLKLRILVDWASVEVFGADGEVALTVQVFPDPASDQLEAFAFGGEARLRTLDVYPLKRIWS